MNHSSLHDAVLPQIFVAVISLTRLILAAVINEREHVGEAFESEKRLLSESEAARERLEERARERTEELEQKAAQLAYQAKLLDLVMTRYLSETPPTRSLIGMSEPNDSTVGKRRSARQVSR